LIEKAQSEGYRFVTISELMPEGDHTVDNNGLCKPAS